MTVNSHPLHTVVIDEALAASLSNSGYATSDNAHALSFPN